MENKFKEGDFIDGGFNVNYVLSARNSGYTNYTALADIVDNSLDNEVKASEINIQITSEKQDIDKPQISSIKICDNGCGMTKSILDEAFKWGAITGKNRVNDLGSYGVGLKIAGISIGRRIEVFTKSIDGEFYVVKCDIDDIISNGNFVLPRRIGTNDEYEKFKFDVNGETGTIVLLSKLDRISNNNLNQFIGKLKKDFGLNYRLFIDEQKTEIKINGEIVKSIDPMYRNTDFSNQLSGIREKFVYKDKSYYFTVFHLENLDEKLNNKLDLPRNYANRGLYIYRNNRLVGGGLDLGIINKRGDGYYNGLRIELFIDGGSDELFMSTTMKVITEKTKDEVDVEFRKICNKAIGQYIKMVFDLEKNKKSKEGVDENIKSEFIDLISVVNDNSLVSKQGGKNKQNEGEKPIKPEPTGRKNKTSTRKRDDSFTDWKFISLGESGNLFNVSKEKGKHVVHMNTDHVFWNEFLSKANNETKGVLIRLFVSMAMSLDSVGYYDEPTKELLLQEYFLEMSINLRKLIIG